MSQQQALARRDQQLMAIKQTLNAKRSAIVTMIGGDDRAERLIGSAMLIVADDQKILACEPGSIVRAVMQAALLGLDLASALGEAYLVPRGGVACLDVGYRGWQRKVHEAGYRLIASPVFAGESFLYKRAPVTLEHEPVLSEAERGDFLGSYAAAYVGRELTHVEWATPEDIERARRMSNSPAWPGWPDRMRRKLAIKRLGKELAGAGSEIIRQLVEVAAVEDTGGPVVGVDDPMDRLLATPDPAIEIPPAGVQNLGRRGPKGASRETRPQEAPESPEPGSATDAPEVAQSEAPGPNSGPTATDSEPPAGRTSMGYAKPKGEPQPEEPPIPEEPPSQAEAAGQVRFDGELF